MTTNPVLTEQQAEFIRKMKAQQPQPQEQIMEQTKAPATPRVVNRGANEKICKFFAKNRQATPAEAVEATGESLQMIYNVRYILRKKNPKYFDAKKPGPKPTESARIPPPLLPMPEIDSPTPDMVNSPPHYRSGGIETIDFIEAKKLNYNLGNVVKYITRADLKGNRKQDLAKALWYLQREINSME